MVNGIVEHWQDVLSIIAGVIGIATTIVKLTSTQKDDAILAKIIKVLSVVSLCNPDGSFIGKKDK